MKQKLKLAILLSACVIAYSQDKPNPNFTGGEVKTVKENSQANIAHFYFPPGVRTKWHSHEGGQIILVEDGVGLYQEKGGPVVELRAGETRYCPPGVVHWHGASPKEGGTQFNVTRGGITWGDVVTDEEFNATPVHK
jgi:quercetin dioxygenase-like cupin family protein